MKLKHKIVVDSKDRVAYPDVLTYWEMMECINMKQGSVTKNEITFYPPFNILSSF